MHHIEGCDRDQAQLPPARIDDYVDRDNPVRFIDAFVDDLGLNGASFARVGVWDRRGRRFSRIYLRSGLGITA
jgi:hypothetical protein